MRGALPFGVESLIPPDSQTPLGLFIAAVSGVFTTMGAGFLYLTGQSVTIVAGQTISVQDVVAGSSVGARNTEGAVSFHVTS